MATKTKIWLGEKFSDLHPLLQNIHTNGAVLSGPVSIRFGNGISLILGKRLAKKLGIPTSAGNHKLQVIISHDNDGLHWDRCFDGTSEVKSTFSPIGEISNGYWLETVGAVQLFLTVDIKNSGWYWRCIKAKYKNITIPLWLFPKTTAYKIIEDGAYRFSVSISVPLFGGILSYSGLLDLEQI